jgi:putative hemolysin
VIGFLGFVFVEAGCVPVPEAPGIANPASEYCAGQGGTLDIRKDADDGEVGYCQFENGSECEEWAFLRGECDPESQNTAPTAGDRVQSPTGTTDDRSGAGLLPEGTMPKPVIMVSDVATGLVGGWRPDVNDIDDGWAIGMAAVDPALELHGVVVTFGNGLVDPQLVVAEKIVNDLIAKTNVPVLRGAGSPLST